MKLKSSKVIALLQMVISLAMIGALKIWAPVCGKLLTLESGKNVPMRCYYTDKAVWMLSVVLLLCSVILIFSKKDVQIIQIISFVVAGLIFFTFIKAIGVCMNTEMPCNKTALWGKCLASASMIFSVIALLSGKEGQLPT